MSREEQIKGFDHPCRQTCSGWQQGYDKGVESYTAFRKENDEIIMKLQNQIAIALEALKGLWVHIDSGYLCRNTEGDNDDSWLIQASALVTDLARAKEALATIQKMRDKK